MAGGEMLMQIISMNLPDIILKPLQHRNALRIALEFAINKKIQYAIKKIDGAAWSKTHKCWHIPHSVKNYQLLIKLLKPIATINITLLKEYQEKQLSFLAGSKPIVKKDAAEIKSSNSTTKQLPRKIVAKHTTGLDSGVHRISLENKQQLAETVKLLKLKAYSTSTIKTYHNELATYFNTLGKTDAASMTIQRVKDYILYCLDKLKLTENTVHSRLNALKFFYEQVLGYDKFFVDIPRPKKHLQLPKVLGEDELRRLFAAPTNLKHKAILFIAYSAGLRVSEVINLRLQDIDRERKQLFIHCSKGKKDRYVRLSPLVLDVLEQYYKLSTHKPTNYLFESTEPGKPYSSRSAQIIFNQAKTKAGISKTVSFHSLRHSYATHMLEKGVDVIYIKEILGHFNIKTTERYLHVRKEFLINIESPLDGLYAKK